DGVDFPFPRVALFVPLAGDQALSLQRVERGVERAFFELQRVAAASLDLPRDPVAVERRVPQDRQHQGRRVPFQKLSCRVQGVPRFPIPRMSLYSGFRGLSTPPASIDTPKEFVIKFTSSR